MLIQKEFRPCESNRQNLGPTFNPVFSRCFTIDLLIQKEFRPCECNRQNLGPTFNPVFSRCFTIDLLIQKEFRPCECNRQNLKNMKNEPSNIRIPQICQHETA